MAIDFNGALTLADQAILSNDPMVKEITKSLHMTWNAVKDIPFYTSPSLRQIGLRYTNSGIPLPTWTGINSQPQAVKGKPKSYEEQLFLMRNMITVDHVLLDQPDAIIDPVDAQVKMFMEGFAYDFNDKFVNNDPTSLVAGNSADCFPGLKYRLDNWPQFDISVDMNIASTADLSFGNILAASSATAGSGAANRLMHDVQNLFDNMSAPDGDGIVLYMNEQTKRHFEMAIRVMGLGSGFDVTQDNFDRPVEQFKNAKVRVVGRKADGLTPVIPSNVTATWLDSAGSAVTVNNSTTIYAVRYGDGYLQGWQPKPLKPEYLGKSQENGIMHNVLFEWGCGLMAQSTRAIGRLAVKIA
jgi:hypothetical protein